MDNAPERLLRFADLKERGIVRNWPTLGRLIKQQGFPPGYLLGPQTRVWDHSAVEAWLQRRREASVPRPTFVQPEAGA